MLARIKTRNAKDWDFVLTDGVDTYKIAFYKSFDHY